MKHLLVAYLPFYLLNLTTLFLEREWAEEHQRPVLLVQHNVADTAQASSSNGVLSLRGL